METFLLAFVVTTLVYSTLLLIKSDNALRNQVKILNAIDAYADETGDCKNALFIMNRMESFSQTMWRLWDWGYTRILPKEDFEWIKPYIKEK